MRLGIYSLTAALACLVATAATAEEIQGEYLEARNADMWTGPCFANGEVNIIGNRATMAWKITKGTFNGVDLAGRHVVAVVFGDKTFGLFDPVNTKTIMIVDQSATSEQRDALMAFAKKMSGETIQDVVSVRSAPIEMSTTLCTKMGCARLDAGVVSILTRCLCDRDSICGHEDLFYPVLADVEHPYAAYTVEHEFTGDEMGETFAHGNSRSAVIASFHLTDKDAVAAR